MSLAAGLKQKVRKLSGRPSPRLLTVKDAWHLTPNMIRVTFAGPELEGFPDGREGGNCKLMLPDLGESRDDFAARLTDGPAPVVSGGRRHRLQRRYNRTPALCTTTVEDD